VSGAATPDWPDLTEFDLRALPRAFYDDPYPWYDALRRHSPIRRLHDGGVLLTRYQDLRLVYDTPDAFSSDKRQEFGPKFGSGRLFRHHTTSLVFNDAPYHTRVRKLVAGALRARFIARREPELEALVKTLLDRMAAKGKADLIADFAGAIPVEVIGDLLKVPKDERGPLRDWSLAILGALEPAPSLTALAAGETALAEFHCYLSGLVAERRAKPRDPDEDLISRLIIGELNTEPLTYDELLENCVFILNAGHETTTNLIGNLSELLWRFPDQRRRLRERPDMIWSAVEEGLRFESSNQLGNRLAVRDSNLRGESIAAGTQITLCIGAANRDPDAFEKADCFDIARTPNRHLAFASGVHTCAGMNLARLEARVAVGALVRRFPDYEIREGAERAARARFRGFRALPVAVMP